MSTQPIPTNPEPLILHMKPFLQKLNDQEFFEFCQLNKDLRIERTSEGDLVIMPPTGGETGRRNFILIGNFNVWVEADGTGIGFDSSTVFSLPNGAKRSPDLAWVKRSRWDQLTHADKEIFPPLCPDFVIELRSPSDSLVGLQEKIQEYMNNGAQLGWLIDPRNKKVYIYSPGQEVICLDNPQTVSGEPTLSGFVLDVQKIFL
jgi:Uma2 family endonuclease